MAVMYSIQGDLQEAMVTEDSVPRQEGRILRQERKGSDRAELVIFLLVGTDSERLAGLPRDLGCVGRDALHGI